MEQFKTDWLDLRLMDNMELMKQYPDGWFDLAVVDPPYGIGVSKGTWGSSNKGKVKNYGKKDWDKQPPSLKYFVELLRVSKNQIVWGGNYFDLYPSSCWIVWDKLNSADFADCELAWTSFNTPVRKFTFRWNGMLQQNMKDKEIRFHPTQKPIPLYEWILKNYAQPNFKIIDTHFGSGSIALAVHRANVLDKMNLHLTACEIDPEYFAKSVTRIRKSISQQVMQF